MKSILFITMLLLALSTFSLVYSQTESSNWGYGIEGGMAIGDNAGTEEVWVPSGRAYFQFVASRNFVAQLGLSYIPVKANDGDGKGYETKTGMADIRFLFSPVQMSVVSPYIYAGIGASKDFMDGNSAFCTVFPAGIGFQTRLGDRVSLDLHGGYTLASDKFDGRKREDGDLNRFVASKYDGFYSLMFGISVNSPFGKKVVKIVPVVAPDPKMMDSDNDGLSDYDESMVYKTDPKRADTDNDGLNDYEEVMVFKTNPNKADTDSDGLSDYEEVKTHKTNPNNIDTDSGGMTDGVEVKAGKNPLDPKDDVPEPAIDLNKIDTDKDGLSDYEETNKYKTDPNKFDTDVDGISDGDEVIKYRTNPLNTDTDGDGLNDYEEVFAYKTDPLKTDSDSDGLSDYAEVKTHRTDPLNVDTDGGGMSDGAEIKANKNPLDPKDDLYVLKKDVKLVLAGINFATASSTILSNSAQTLQKVYESLEANPDVSILITGHTDNVGTDSYNQDLSMRRANSVKTWLVNKGISSSRIKVAGMGESEPIASNETPDGRAQNRRIEMEATN